MSVPRFDALDTRIVGVEIRLSAGVDMEGGSWMASNLKGISSTCKSAWYAQRSESIEGYIERQDLVSVGIAL